MSRKDLSDDPTRLFQALELMQVDALLFERPHEALGEGTTICGAEFVASRSPLPA